MSAGGNILAITAQFQERLRRRELAAERELSQAYIQVRRDIDAALTDVTNRIERLREAGQEVRISDLQSQARYRTLLNQVDREIDQIANNFGATVERLRAEALDMGGELAERLMLEQGLQNVARLPNQEVAELIGRLQQGSPLDEILSKLGPEAREQVQNRLVAGIVSGHNPAQVAREISNALGGNMSRAMTIARTEQITAYRNAALLNYRQFPNLLQGWVWTAAVSSSPPPCPVCTALHGRIFPLDAPFGSHPNCRCSAAPLTRGARVPFVSGDQWFSSQSAGMQRDILGPAGHLAYQDGAVSLSDFAQLVDDPQWGPQWKRRSLTDLLGSDAAKYFERLRAA